MPSYHPVFIHFGPDALPDKEIQESVTTKEKEIGRPLKSSEILETMGEAVEPDAAKRIFLSARPPSKMPKLWFPEKDH